MTLIIINTEGDLPTEATKDFAVTGDYATKWKALDGAWIKQVVTQEAQDEITDEDGNVTQEKKDEELNWSDPIFFFDYRFHIGEKPLYGGSRIEGDADGNVKKLFTHNADHQTEWDVEFIGFN